MTTVSTPVTIPAQQAPLYVALAQIQKPHSDNAERTMLRAYIAMFKTKAHDDITEALASPSKDERAAAKESGKPAPKANIVATWCDMGYAENTAAKMHSQLRGLVKAWYSGAVINSVAAHAIIENEPGYQKAVDAAVRINAAVAGKTKETKQTKAFAEHLAAEIMRNPDATAQEQRDAAILRFDLANELAAREALIEKAVDAAAKVDCVLMPASFKSSEALVQWLCNQGYDAASIGKACANVKAKATVAETIAPAPVAIVEQANAEA